MKPLLNPALTSLLDSFGSILCCPRSGQELRWTKESAFSVGDNREYPLVGSVPWLLPEPKTSLAHWIEKRKDLNSYFSERIHQIKFSIDHAQLKPTTHQRLETLQKALEHNHKTLQEILSVIPSTLHPPLIPGNKIPTHQSLTLYLKNIFRDWFWSNDENRQAFESVKKVLPTPWTPRKFITLGAGSSRLSIDLHHQYKLNQSLAVDFNPLLLLMAQKALQHQDVKLYDIPQAPIEISQVTKEYSLINPHGTTNSFHLLFADIQALPFKKKSLDSVFTPWVIDILPMKFETLAKKINTLLKANAEWINFGPLGFMSTQESERLTFEEIQDSLKDCGFEVIKHSFDEIPYLCSPLGSQKRYEKVVSFRAIKTQDVDDENFQYLPEWLLNHDMPIPATSDIKSERLRSKINADILFSIDGQRSINELTNLMSQQYKLPLEQARQIMLNFFLKHYESRLRRD